ncbi:MAG TPA: YfcC family protein [Tissierellia bacterium]|nr:YfcC family protein [Tissierellia bacterium]
MTTNNVEPVKEPKPKRKFVNPHSYFIIILLILISVIATWLIPAGSYERVTDPLSGREVVDPESFHYIERTPVGPFDAAVAIPQGIAASAGIIAFIFIVAGGIAVVKSTGAIDTGIVRLVKAFQGKDVPLLIITMFITSLLGTTLGFAQEMIPFIALGIAMATSLGYDRVVGFHIVRTACWIGFAASTINPYVVSVAQEMSGLPIMSGMGLRVVAYIVFMLISGWFFLSYAKKVKQDPQKSILHGYESTVDPKTFEVQDFGDFTLRHKLVLTIFAIGLLIMVWGAIQYGWGTNQMGATLFITSVLCGFAGGYGPNKVADEFSKGMVVVTGGALIAGFTRAIAIILSNGQILDTIVYGLSQPLMHVSGAVTSVGMTAMYSLLTFFIGSAAGRAAATLPIMIPLSDILGITRQTVVLAFTLGGGITNMFWPNMIYVLAFADIPYDRWFKHIWKLALYLFVAASVLVSIAYFTNYGPF